MGFLIAVGRRDSVWINSSKKLPRCFRKSHWRLDPQTQPRARKKWSASCGNSVSWTLKIGSICGSETVENFSRSPRLLWYQRFSTNSDKLGICLLAELIAKCISNEPVFNFLWTMLFTSQPLSSTTNVSLTFSFCPVLQLHTQYDQRAFPSKTAEKFWLRTQTWVCTDTFRHFKRHYLIFHELQNFGCGAFS